MDISKNCRKFALSNKKDMDTTQQHIIIGNFVTELHNTLNAHYSNNNDKKRAIREMVKKIYQSAHQSGYSEGYRNGIVDEADYWIFAMQT